MTVRSVYISLSLVAALFISLSIFLIPHPSSSVSIQITLPCHLITLFYRCQDTFDIFFHPNDHHVILSRQHSVRMGEKLEMPVYCDREDAHVITGADGQLSDAFSDPAVHRRDLQDRVSLCHLNIVKHFVAPIFDRGTFRHVSLRIDYLVCAVPQEKF